MSEFTIVEVESKKDLKRFVRFPLELYKNCPQYVPALDSSEISSLTKCSTLAYCERKMWLAKDGSKVVGRIAAMINPRYNELYGTKRVRFGWFDVINDIEVARLLLDTAENWARSKGMTQVHGPLYYNTLGKQGMLVEGFENIPPFNCLYNYKYYNDFMLALGYERECDWIQYELDVDVEVPDALKRISERIKERGGLREADFGSLKKDKSLVHDFFRMYSDSFTDKVYNFIPFTDEEIEEEASSISGFLDDKLSCVLVDGEGEMAGFGIGIPFLSQAFQKAGGKLFPLGWIYLLKALRNREKADLMLNGASPKWQKSGISSVYHVLMSEKYRRAGVKKVITNPQIETNSAVNVWSRYENKRLYMRRRCYLKNI